MSKKRIILLVSALLVAGACSRSESGVEISQDTLKPAPLSPKKEVLEQEEMLVPTDIKDKKVLIENIKKLVVRYEDIEKEIAKLPALPKDNAIYKDHISIQESSKNLRTAYIEHAKKVQETENIGAIIRLYENVASFVVGHRRIELMARKAELYRKEFPNNTEISQLIQKTFEGNYASLDGNQFISSLNAEYIANFNKVVELVNQLRVK